MGSADPVLHYDTRGDSSHPPLLFLHGFMGDSADWEDVVSHLSDRYYCVTPDLPGHGRSLRAEGQGGRGRSYSLTGAAEAVKTVMRDAGLIPATVVGYSMGGRIALCLATRHPTICSKLVIESATPGIADPQERQHRLRLDVLRARRLQERGLPDFLRAWYRQPIFETIAESPTRLESIIRRRSDNDPSAIGAVLIGMSVGGQESLWDELSHLNMPVLLIAGERDGKYVDVVQAMAAGLPMASVKIMPQCGHTVHLEDPSGFARRLERFLQQA